MNEKDIDLHLMSQIREIFIFTLTSYFQPLGRFLLKKDNNRFHISGK